MPLLHFILIFLLLSLPLAGSDFRFDGWMEWLEFLLATALLALAWTALHEALQRSARGRWQTGLVVLFWIGLAACFLVRLSWFLALDFSGAGFTADFFDHFSLRSAQLGLQEYAWQLLALGFAFLVFAFLLNAWGQRRAAIHAGAQDRVPAQRSAAWTVLALACLGLLAGLPLRSPERELVTGYLEYRSLVRPGELALADRARLAASGFVNMGNNDRTGLRAAAGPGAKNLVLVYLESFNLAFTGLGPLPGLTPGIDRMLSTHAYHPNWLSSADATMEALISTQCGTLVASPRGGSTFANVGPILPGLACLPDVLRAAGYQQVFLGGFDKSFTQKGPFLLEHGFDEVRGWEDWQQLGHRAPQGHWGLPDDALFEAALARIAELAGDSDPRPFNLTLLTLGLHPPGFVSPSCSPWAGADADARMLQSIHCTDQLLSRFVAELEGRGLLRDTLLVLTSDHDVFNLPEITQHFPALAEDPRLLMLALDEGQAVQWPQPVNIAYDLPPTLLDLLAVEHNRQFIWGVSAVRSPAGSASEAGSAQRLTRNFRVRDSQPPELPSMEFMSSEFMASRAPDCSGEPEPLSVVADDCTQAEIIRLADQYLAGFTGAAPAPPALCTDEAPLRVSIRPDAALEMEIHGASHAQRFADRGRPLDPMTPGFYLYLKASARRSESHYFYPLDHVVRQAQLVAQLLELSEEEQFVLAYLPGPDPDPDLAEPLAQLLADWGVDQPSLDSAFAVAARADPGADQVFSASGAAASGFQLRGAQCRALAEPRSGPSRLHRSSLHSATAELLRQFPNP